MARAGSWTRIGGELGTHAAGRFPFRYLGVFHVTIVTPVALFVRVSVLARERQCQLREGSSTVTDLTAGARSRVTHHTP